MKEATVLIVTTVPETLMTILAHQPRFLNRSFNVHLACAAGGSVESISAREGVPVHGVAMKRGISPFADVRSIFLMCQLLLKLKPSVVQSYTPKAGLVTMIAALLCRVPVRIHTFTGLIFPTQTGFKKKLLIYIDRLICLCATKVVPEGEGVKKDLQNYAITTKEMSVIGHGNIAGVDVAYFKPDIESVMLKSHGIQSDLGIKEGDFTFCYVGRLNRDKGLKELAQAFLNLPEHTHLIVVGGLDSEAPVDEKTLAFFKQHPRVHMLGFQEDIREALQASSALVLPSYREGFPNVVLQAGAMGKPAVVTDINGSNEIIEPGVNGWLAMPRDVASLQLAMMQAIDSPSDTLAAMSAFARSRVVERFEQAAHWERIKEFYLQELNID